MDTLIKRIDRLERTVLAIRLEHKKLLNSHEACLYLRIKKGSLYSHTSEGTISFYKPHGKELYFKRRDLDEWLMRNKHLSAEELILQTEEYLKQP